MAKVFDIKVVVVSLESEDYNALTAEELDFVEKSGDNSLIVYRAMERQGWRVSRILRKETPVLVEVYAFR